MIRLVALAKATVVLLFVACESDSYVKDRREEGPTTDFPSTSELTTSERELARTAPVAREALREALRGGGEAATLAQALTSSDHNQASMAAAALLTHYGCEVVRGTVREALIRQARIFPTPHGVILLGCLRGEEEAIDAIRSFRPTGVHLAWFGLPFPDWEAVRAFALAESGDSLARKDLLSRLRDRDRELTIALLNRSVFPYVQDRHLLLALSESMFDSRRRRPGGEAGGDFPNPRISEEAVYAYAFRFSIRTPRDERGRPRPFTEAEQRAVYEEVRQVLLGLEEGQRLPQKRLAGRHLP